MVKKTTKQIKKANSTAKIKTKVNPNTKIKTKVIPVIKAKTKVNPNIKTKVKAKPKKKVESWKVFKQKVIRDLKNAKTEEEFSIVINRIVTFIMTARLNSLTRNFNIQINKLSRI